MLKLPTDRWLGQSSCIHEFAHLMMAPGFGLTNPAFHDEVLAHYIAIKQSDFIARTYMGVDMGEYWAVAVTAWYNANRCATVPDGVNGPLCSHASFAALDPGGYELVSRVFNLPPAAPLY